MLKSWYSNIIDIVSDSECLEEQNLVGKAGEDVKLTAAETPAPTAKAEAPSKLDKEREEAPTTSEEEMMEMGAAATEGELSSQAEEGVVILFKATNLG